MRVEIWVVGVVGNAKSSKISETIEVFNKVIALSKQMAWRTAIIL
jgi:hypothetical protein